VSDSREFAIDLTRASAYHFQVEFDQAGVPVLDVDEPPPLGAGSGPNAARLLGTAIGHCLASSLLFCLGKARVEVQGLKARVTGTITRNEAGRFRVTSVRVQLLPGIAAEDRERIGRCLEIFQDFCIVTESVRKGLEVQVEVEPQTPA
jgi:organic hydroperoxide reductase OsmC/OhrA